MIRLPIPKCPRCGKWFPWKTYATKVVQGQKRSYVICRECGYNDVICYFDDKKEPNSDEKGSF